MMMRRIFGKWLIGEDLNFLLTNRIPRRWATRFVGWVSQIEQPLIRDFSIGLWRLFSDLDLSDAKTTKFKSMHECFTRELKAGARPIDSDPQVMISPCDVCRCSARDSTHAATAGRIARPAACLFVRPPVRGRCELSTWPRPWRLACPLP